MMSDIIRLKSFSPLFNLKIHKQQQLIFCLHTVYIRNVDSNYLLIDYTIKALCNLPVLLLFPQL